MNYLLLKEIGSKYSQFLLEIALSLFRVFCDCRKSYVECPSVFKSLEFDIDCRYVHWCSNAAAFSSSSFSPLLKLIHQQSSICCQFHLGLNSITLAFADKDC